MGARPGTAGPRTFPAQRLPASAADRPGMDWLPGVSVQEVPAEHFRQRAAPIHGALENGEDGALPDGAGLPGCCAIGDHLEQAVRFDGVDTRSDEALPRCRDEL